MKISVSLPREDLTFLDEYGRKMGVSSRSEVVHKAIELLSRSNLEEAYVAAWDEWTSSLDAALWENTVGDGVVSAEG